MSASPLTPVILLTGFLGSGKTTLLNRLLAAPGLADSAVLINEYGSVPIDHQLVRAGSERIEVLSNGCICCSVAGDLVRVLRDLYFKRANGEIPAFRRVIIETTGLADPAPVMHTLLEMPLVAARYVLSGVITTVDAQHGAAQLDQHPEAVKQAAVADRIVLTKTDLVDKDVDGASVAALAARLSALNPGAVQTRAVHGVTDFASLLDTGLYRPDGKSADVHRWLNEAAYKVISSSNKAPTSLLAASSATPRTESLDVHNAHDARINSWVMRIGHPVDWDALESAIETLQGIAADRLLRIKGIVNVAGREQPMAIHAVQHSLYPPVPLPAWPDDDHSTRIVFIVRDLSPEIVSKVMAGLMDDQEPNPIKLSNHSETQTPVATSTATPI
ncbi:MAG: CobW family GTP-binding protein [Burkholderiales bacterium]|jgi:G3E family GTPase|nr:GTP-binding protein [Nitrosomonadaceae bacterium]